MNYYTLRQDISHLGDIPYDAEHIPFENSKELRYLMFSDKKIDIKTPLYFDADFEIPGDIDYLVNDLDWPIISKKMYEVILKCGDFKHEVIPVCLVDDTVCEDRFDNKGIFNSSIPVNNDYIALHIQEFPDIFDYEKSVYEKHPIIPGQINTIEKLVLVNGNSIPQIFKLKEGVAKIFINEELKNLFFEYKIKGLNIKHIDEPLSLG